MKILIFVCLLITLKSTTIDLSQKNVFCIYKDLSPGSIHLSVEFIGENTETSSIQVFFLIFQDLNHFFSKISYMSQTQQKTL